MINCNIEQADQPFPRILTSVSKFRGRIVKPDVIPLDLSAHCIEAELKKLYNQALNRLLRVAALDPDLERHFELLSKALKVMDFKALRWQHPALAGKRESGHVELAAAGGNDMSLLVDGEEVRLRGQGGGRFRGKAN